MKNIADITMDEFQLAYVARMLAGLDEGIRAAAITVVDTNNTGVLADELKGTIYKAPITVESNNNQVIFTLGVPFYVEGDIKEFALIAGNTVGKVVAIVRYDEVISKKPGFYMDLKVRIVVENSTSL